MLQRNPYLPGSNGTKAMANAIGLLRIQEKRRLESQKRYRYHAHSTVCCCTQKGKPQTLEMQLKVRSIVTGRPRGSSGGRGKNMR